ncbi:hypothetical protein PInf_024478 [Phytophthora infestans]|nr:hypothetical protein PInf_024478 [Phytophthora infestans]
MMQGSGSKKKKILRYHKEVSGKVVLPKDVENRIAKMRKETYTSGDDNVRVDQVLKDLARTAHMRRMVRKFPDAVCVDATYGTNIDRVTNSCDTGDDIGDGVTNSASRVPPLRGG